MAKIVIVDSSDMKIVSSYEADQPNQKNYGGPWGNPDLFKHIMVPENEVSEFLVASEDGGEVVISKDIQPERNAKLAILRSLRDQKMSEVDIMVNDLAVGDRTDTTQVREYRSALKDITDDHKYVNDDTKGKASLDAFENDMSDFVWPTKP